MSNIRKDLPAANTTTFNERVREAMQTYLGYRGDPLDRGVILRDLVDSGLTTINPGFLASGRGNPIGGAGTTIADAYEVDLTPPPTPTGFIATSAISNVLVESDAQLYTMGHGHAKSVLYGATWISGPLPIFTDAQVLTEFQGTVASYATNPATTWHLWLKWVTVDGVPSVTPAGGTNGFVVTTGQDVATLLTALTAQITESQLFSTLGTRINLIDAGTGVAGSVNQRLDSQNTNLSAQIAAVAVGTGDGFDTAAIWYFDTAVDGWTGSPTAPSVAGGFIRPVDGTATYLISPSALAVASATFNQVKLRIRKVGTPTWAGKVWWADVAQDLITPGRSFALAAPTFDANGIGVVTVTPGWTGNLDRIRLDLVAVQDASNYIEVDWLGIGRSAPGASVASVQTESSARIATDGGLLAQNTVKIDVAGLVSGYGLASTAGNAAPTSAFGVRANQFFIAPPATVSATAPTVDLYDGYCWLDTGVTPNVTRYRSGAAWVLVSPALPFVVQVSPTTINGVAVPAGVYANDLYVKNGTITNAKIANLAVDNAKIASMSVDKLTAGTLQVGAYIQSTNYIPGASGWHLNANGTLHALAGYLQGVEVRNSAGTVLLNAGDTANDVRNSTIVVGGRNLLLNSAVERTGGNEYLLYDNLSPVFDTHGLGEYTFSFDLKTAVAGNINVYVEDRAASLREYQYTYGGVSATTGYQRFSKTVTVTSLTPGANHTSLAFYGEYGSGRVPSVKNVKIERGNKATDWTPAPEDVDAGIAGAATTSTWAGVSSRPTDAELLNSYATIGQNLIPNSDQTSAKTSVAYWYSGVSVLENMRYASELWADTYVLSGGTTRNLISRQGVPAAGDNSTIALDVHVIGAWTASNSVPVVAGQRYIFSAYLQAHRCNFAVGIDFFNAGDGVLSSHLSDAVGGPGGAADSLAAYSRQFIAGVAPSGAAYARVYIRKYNTWAGQVDSYIWYAASQFEAVTPNAAGPSPYTAGTASSTRQLGFTGDLNATANQSDATTNNAIAAKLNNAGANVMNSGFFLQTNGYAGGNGVALYDGGLIGKRGSSTHFILSHEGLNIGDYTGFNWPASGGGAHLSGDGLLMGNGNTGKYFRVDYNGDIYSPGYSIVNGVMTLSAVNVVNTLNIGVDQVTIPRSNKAASYGATCTVVMSVSAPIVVVVTFNGAYIAGATFKIFRNGVEILSTVANSSGGVFPVFPVTTSTVDNPGVGTWTYTCSSNQSVVETIMFAMGAKR